MPATVLGVAAPVISSSNPGAIAVTVPTGTLGVVVMFRSNFDTFSVSSSFSGTFVEIPPLSGTTVRMFVAPVTSTGSQTISPDFGTYIAEGPAFFAAFVDGIDNSTIAAWVRDAVCEESTPLSVASTATDLVIAMDNWATGSASVPPNQSGWTSYATQANNNLGGRVRSADSPGASTTTATAQTGAGGAFSGLCVISLIGASGPSEDFQEETISFSDAQQAVAKFIGESAETITFADTQAATADLIAAQSESITLSDSQVATNASAAAQDESLTLVDSAVAVQVSPGAVSETITLSDASEAVAHFAAAQDESISLADSQDATEPGEALQEEQLTLTDSQSATQVSSAQVGESITFVDAVTTPEDASIPFGGGFFSKAWRKRLFEEEMREKLKELPQQVAEVIENTVIEAIDRPKKPTQKELWRAFDRENIPYREAYRKAVVSMVQEMRQREEDEEEEEAIALAVASLI